MVGAKLDKEGMLVPVTDELLEDAPSFGNYLVRVAANNFTYARTRAMIAGEDVGGNGYVKSGALVVVTPTGGAGTVAAADLQTALGRVAADSIPKCLCVQHPDAYEQVLKLPYPTFTPADAGAPFGRALGRPILVTEAAEGLGKIGDCAFVDPSQIFVITRDPETRAAFSAHFYFDQAISCFRITMRFTCLPAVSQPTQSRDSANFRSPFVAIGPRP